MGLVLAHESILDKNSLEPVAEASMPEDRYHRAIDASTEGIDGKTITYGVSDRSNLFINKGLIVHVFPFLTFLLLP